MPQALSTNNYGPAKFIVDATLANGTHSTIASAITSASSGDTIFIRPGTYTENLILKVGVNLTAFGSDSSQNATGHVIISGTCTLTTAGSVTIYGIQLQTNSAALLAVTGTLASVVNLDNCYLNATNADAITFSSSSGSAAINMKDCNGNLGTTGIKIFAHSSSGVLTMVNCYFKNSGASTTASTISAGTLNIFTSLFFSPITSSSTATWGMTQSGIDTSAQNATCATVGGSGAHTFNECSFTSGSASAVSNSNTTLLMALCYVNTSNTNALTGGGTLTYQGIVFTGSSFKINTTTQVGGLLKGNQTTVPSTGFIGEVVTSFQNSVGVSTPTTITTISLTAGVWDLTGFVFFDTSTSNASVTLLEATVSSSGGIGTAGADTARWQDVSGTGQLYSNTLTIPPYRITPTTNTTYYLTANSTGTSFTSCSGTISATRIG